MRSKLYERARSTIQRQLTSRNPPLTGEDLTLEMDRLEQAIVDIEGQYNPAPEASPVEHQAEFESTLEAPVAAQSAASASPETPEITPVETAPVLEVSAEPPATYEPEPPAPPPIAELSPEPDPGPLQAAPEPAPPEPEPALAPPIPVFNPPAPEPEVEPQPVSDPIPDLALEIPTLPPSEPQPQTAEQPPVVAAQAEVVPVVQSSQPIAAPAGAAFSAPEPAQSVEPEVDPVEEWAKEFLSHEPGQAPAPQPAQVSAEAVAPAIHEAHPQPALTAESPDIGSHLVPQAPLPTSTAVPPAHELPAFDPAADESLGIPPAPGFSPRTPRRSKKRGVLKWLLLLIVLGVIAASGYFGWQSRATIVENLGLESWFVDPQDPQTPKKVKTITIKPDPIEPVDPAENSEPPNSDKPKAETRIPAESAAPVSDIVEVEPTPANTAPPISQSAVLYEEGATAADSSIDRGRVVWSVVQQAPLEGLPSEPAVQARVEVPARKLVLNMTIRRNADKSLPASHVIELNFTVPKEFSGGAIGQIRSLVFKGSEQGQGKALVGVPVQLTEGQFILALNNLESAQKTNVDLIENSGWIDVPMLYRTGRRAFITIEKGAPGEKIFKEVFAAWGQQTAR